VPDGCCCAPPASAGTGHQGPPQGIPNLTKERKRKEKKRKEKKRKEKKRKEKKRKEKKRKDYALGVLVLVIKALLKVSPA